MMKRWMMCLLVGCFGVFLVGNCWGAMASNNALMLVDGILKNSSSDGHLNEVNLKLTVVYAPQNWVLGYWDSEFKEFGNMPYTIHGAGGNTIDLAICKYVDGKLDQNTAQHLGAGDGAVGFIGSNLFSVADALNPGNVTEWYNSASIFWALLGEGSFSVEIAAAEYLLDGITLASSVPSTVPIPTTAFLLGTGVLGLVGVRRKFIK